jgi:hypothetical protein
MTQTGNPARSLVPIFSRLSDSDPNPLLCIIVFMSDDDAARFRKQAEECREQAAKAISPLDKEAWLRTSEEWLKLAQSVDDRKR